MAIPGISGEDLLTVEDVAKRLGIKEERVRKLARKRIIQPLAAMGGSLAFRVREIERYEKALANPHIMNITQIAKFYGISRRRADMIFRLWHRTLAVDMDHERGLMYDMSRNVHRHIEARYKLKPRRGENGQITFKLDG